MNIPLKWVIILLLFAAMVTSVPWAMKLIDARHELKRVKACIVWQYQGEDWNCLSD